jgi:hypothetical protein
VPDIVCTAGEFEALLTNDSEADVAPLAPGVKVTLKGADCPAETVIGKLIPESANSLLLRLAEATVTAVPLAFNDPLSVERNPTVTLLKFSAAGDAESCPTAVAVPDRGMASDAFDAVEVTVRFPLAAPALAGRNVAVNVTLWFAESVRGKLSPLMEKPAPVAVA